MQLKREWLEDLIFGSEASRRFTQDSQILPDVWIEFGRRYCRDKHDPLDLLLTPHRNSTTAELAIAVEKALKKERTPAWRKRHAARPVKSHRLAYNQATVAVQVYFEELLRVLLPLTPWWEDHIPEFLETQPARLRSPQAHARVQKAMGLAFKGQTTDPSTLSVEVLWMIRLIGVILLAERAPRNLSASGEEKRFKAIVKDKPGQIRAVAGLMASPKLTACDSKPLWLVSRNRPAFATVYLSTLAIKADAARKLFDISCKDLAWAIVDSGVDARHPAFRDREYKTPEKPEKPEKDWTKTSRVRATYDFTRIRDLLNPDLDAANPLPSRFRKPSEDAKQLRQSLQNGRPLDWGLLEKLVKIEHDDSYEPPVHTHGTHVAGILAGDWLISDEPSLDEDLQGVCPDLRIYDLRVLDADGNGDEFSVMAALQFIRYLNRNRSVSVIHGANLSLSIPHDVANYACGQTPVCDECARVVASGVVVVAAAGNEGYMQYLTPRGDVQGYRSISIADPGNAEEVITVGATHRHQPHTYGVSYFSSRGPTGDGRLKPDLVAPGEKIKGPVPGPVPMSKDGTSMAAPHVSGAAALLMARHEELRGNPQRVKKILCDTATDLGREKYFQGRGMVDVLRALQSV